MNIMNRKNFLKAVALSPLALLFSGSSRAEEGADLQAKYNRLYPRHEAAKTVIDTMASAAKIRVIVPGDSSNDRWLRPKEWLSLLPRSSYRLVEEDYGTTVEFLNHKTMTDHLCRLHEEHRLCIRIDLAYSYSLDLNRTHRTHLCVYVERRTTWAD